jgi:hypothetical protein
VAPGYQGLAGELVGAKGQAQFPLSATMISQRRQPPAAAGLSTHG